MSVFMSADKAKQYSQSVNFETSAYKKRLAEMIEQNAKQGNTAVFTILPKHLDIADIHSISADLTQLGYSVRFEVKEFYYSFNVHWN